MWIWGMSIYKGNGESQNGWKITNDAKTRDNTPKHQKLYTNYIRHSILHNLPDLFFKSQLVWVVGLVEWAGERFFGFWILETRKFNYCSNRQGGCQKIKISWSRWETSPNIIKTCFFYMSVRLVGSRAVFPIFSGGVSVFFSSIFRKWS